MKKTIAILSLCAAIFCTAACTGDIDFAQGFSVTINTSSLTTKAQVNGVEALNENTIKTVDWFIYANGNESVAVKSGHLDTDTKENFSFVVDLKETDYNTIFTANTAKMYTVINLPAGTTLAENASLADVKATALAADFASAETQSLFVMRGEATITANKTAGSASVVIDAERVASKIQMAVTSVATHTDDSGNTWYAFPESISYSLYNVNNAGTIGGEIPSTETASLFDVDSKRSVYYTYPESWSFNGIVPVPYFIITMTVSNTATITSESVVKTCYYKAVLPNEMFESNCWYSYTVNLKILGSFDAINPTLVAAGNYFVYDWGGEHQYIGGTTAGSIADIRYLTLEKNEYTAYNKNTLEIPFTSSHSVVVTNQKVSYEAYNSTSKKIETVTNSVDWVTVEGSSAKFSHTLNNDITSADIDTSPYTVTFRLQHADDANIYEDVTLVQTPAIIIKGEDNGAYGTGNTGLGTRGDAYVNGQTRNIYGSTPYYNTIRTRSSGQGFMYVIETKVLPQGANYIITDPRFDQPNKIMIPYTESTKTGSTYGLGDPGDVIDLFPGDALGNEPSNTSNPGLATAPAVDGTTRKMQYYYATQTTKESENFIAPKFRVSSSFASAGAIGSHTKYFDMARRCATYQEAGFPAGRWRMPTKAEIIYISQLQVLGKVPFIYNEAGSNITDASGYYCASTGLIGFNVDKGTSFTSTEEIYYTRSIRCVYDEWYWENMDNNGKVDRATFTWGDMPR